MTKDDPVVQRVREVRRRIAEKAGYDHSRLLSWGKQIEMQHADQVVGFQLPRNSQGERGAQEQRRV